jgi:lipoyl(octanoyl) transferase
MSTDIPLANYWLGEVDYTAALDLQQTLRRAVLEGRHPGAILFLTHPPTLTLGRHAGMTHIINNDGLAAPAFPVHRVQRGGDVTYHGPGQLVGYPVLSLRQIRRGVHSFVVGLADAISRAVATWDVEAVWQDTTPGLWIGDDKLAAFGVHIHRQVTGHGFAVNVRPDLTHYERIIACGLAHRGITSLLNLLGPTSPTLNEVRERIRDELAEELGFRWVNVPLPALNDDKSTVQVKNRVFEAFREGSFEYNETLFVNR